MHTHELSPFTRYKFCSHASMLLRYGEKFTVSTWKGMRQKFYVLQTFIFFFCLVLIFHSRYIKHSTQQIGANRITKPPFRTRITDNHASLLNLKQKSRYWKSSYVTFVNEARDKRIFAYTADIFTLYQR